jgi:hypothetical protein
MEVLLSDVLDVHHPVIVAGDLNTSGSDSTPTSIENFLFKQYGDIDFWTTKGIQWTTGWGVVYTGAKFGRSLTGIQTRVDPTSANIQEYPQTRSEVFSRPRNSSDSKTGRPSISAEFPIALPMGLRAL